jgi:ComF family protein
MRKTGIASTFAGLLWPHRCVACSARLDPDHTIISSSAFCPRCTETLLWSEPPRCTCCAIPYDGVGQDHLCLSCQLKPPPYLKIHAPLLYGGAAAEALLRFKYGPTPQLAKPLGDILLQVKNEIGPADIVIPIPLHPKRLRERQFNQSALLAMSFSKAIHTPLSTGILRRIKNTPAQAGLGRSERLANQKDAFGMKNSCQIKGKQILLVDDVITTTATVLQATRILMAGGARSVEIVAFARASGTGQLAP